MIISAIFWSIVCFIGLVIAAKLDSNKLIGVVIIVWGLGMVYNCVLPFFVTIPGYSSGERVCTVEKISNKGVFVKTWEGTGILQGFDSDKSGLKRKEWNFSVKEDSVAKKIERFQGKKVSLRYEENYVTKLSDGATDYIVTDVKLIE